VFLVGYWTFESPHPVNLFLHQSIKISVHTKRDPREAVLSKERDIGQADAEAADAALAASGDASAFERLYRVHVARIHSLAHRMTSADDADELTQDVFVRAWEKLGTFRGESAFGTWLYRLAVNVILGKRAAMGRNRERIQGGDELLEHSPSRSVTPDLTVDFESAIERLPEGAKRVFVLHDIEGYKHKEVAEMLGVTAGTSKAQLHRARMALRQYVER
jgi:RNA polymerase sigma-70 factor (ECF subfamily)